jgi:hypothetical protein
MTGRWIARIGVRLLHRETFAMMLSPAIADLQFETAAHGAARPCDYCGALRALAGALWFDVSGDLIALKSDLDMIALLTFLQTTYYTFMLVLLSGFGTGRLVSVVADSAMVTRALSYVGGVGIACLVTSFACFWPARRTHVARVED